MPAPSTPSRWGVKRTSPETRRGPGTAYLNLYTEGETPKTPATESKEEAAKEPATATTGTERSGEPDAVQQSGKEEQRIDRPAPVQKKGPNMFLRQDYF